jgi:hypothetical protein
LALGGIGLQGCGSSSKSAVKATTTGQELTDLKRALDEGVISKSEYERKRGEILRH